MGPKQKFTTIETVDESYFVDICIHGKGRKGCSREGPIVDFPKVAKTIFAGEEKWQNFILNTRN